MKFTKPDLHLLALCISALVLFAVGGARVFHSSNDFVPVYTGARCLLHGCNPYDTSQLEQQFYQAGGHAGELPSWLIDVPVYPPSTFLVLSPLALLPFPAARLLWFLLSGSLLVSAAGSFYPSVHHRTGGWPQLWSRFFWLRQEFCWYWVSPRYLLFRCW